MEQRAFFGPPRIDGLPGGAHIAVYLVPVFEGQLVVFDIHGPKEVAGRWLPWDILAFRGNPYECASALSDDWCAVSMVDLALADIMSFDVPGEGWELAIVFRAELEQMPAGDDVRQPALLAPGALDAIGNFDPADLDRWLAERPSALRQEAGGAALVF